MFLFTHGSSLYLLLTRIELQPGHSYQHTNRGFVSGPSKIKKWLSSNHHFQWWIIRIIQLQEASIYKITWYQFHDIESRLTPSVTEVGKPPRKIFFVLGPHFVVDAAPFFGTVLFTSTWKVWQTTYINISKFHFSTKIKLFSSSIHRWGCLVAVKTMFTQ